MRRCYVVLAVLTLAVPASAQDRWLLVPAVVNGENVSTGTLEQALPASQLQTNRAAATSLEARHSSAPPQLDEKEMSRALKLVRDVTDEVRAGNRGDRVGRKLLRELEKLEAPLQDYLQRDEKRAELLFQACVLAGGLLLQDEPEEAQELLRVCARTYPGRTPQAAPKVRQAYEKAAAAVAAEPHGSLEVTAAEGCAVRLNGALVGTTPLHLKAARVGTARIQLECGAAAGRVHAIPIEPSSHQRLDLDAQFEQALRTEQGLSLAYSDASQRERAMTRHGELLAKILNARVVLLIPIGDDRVRALSLQPRAEFGSFSTKQVSAESLRPLRTAMGPAQPSPALSPATISPAEDEEPALPTPPRPPPPRPSSNSDAMSTGQVITGGALIALGVSSLATAWIFYANRVDTRLTTTGSFAERDAYRSSGSAALWFAAGGGVLLSAAEYLLLPNELSIPTSAWIWGGGGALLVATGVGLMLTNSQCSAPNPACRGLTTDVTFGALVALHALPLLAVPFNYALQNWLRPKRRIELGLQGTHATLTYRF